MESESSNMCGECKHEKMISCENLKFGTEHVLGECKYEKNYLL